MGQFLRLPATAGALGPEGSGRRLDGAPGDGRHDMLVFHEFGADVVERCRAAGFELELLRSDDNPALVTFIARRPR